MTSNSASSGLYGLLQPFGGLFSRGSILSGYGDEPKLTTQVLGLGDLRQVDHRLSEHSNSASPVSVTAMGTGLDEKDSLLHVLAEGLERYCTCISAEEQFIRASGSELGSKALDLDKIPRCSKSELSHPKCPLVAPSKKAPIRWVRGLSLLDGRTTYVPVVMTYLHTGITSPSEKICVQITTGCAAHVSYDRALLNAILEVVERDALSITWLQQLPLPRIEIDSFSSPLGEYWDRYQKCSEDLTYAFFDATTDLEIPTVYGLQISPTDKRLTTLVSCASAMTPALAVIKVMREMEALRIAFRNPPPVPQDCDDYTELMHGATFMARAEQADKFDFLLRSGRSTALSNIPSLQCSDEKEGLRTILERFRHKRLDVYAVDLSTDEALRSGVRVVRVIIPGLQPFSFKYRAQYLGHPRLYEAPKKMRHRVRKEAELNPWPQPFA